MKLTKRLEQQDEKIEDLSKELKKVKKLHAQKLKQQVEQSRQEHESQMVDLQIKLNRIL